MGDVLPTHSIVVVVENLDIEEPLRIADFYIVFAVDKNATLGIRRVDKKQLAVEQ